jgi:hypothetical protein
MQQVNRARRALACKDRGKRKRAREVFNRYGGRSQKDYAVRAVSEPLCAIAAHIDADDCRFFELRQSGNGGLADVVATVSRRCDQGIVRLFEIQVPSK